MRDTKYHMNYLGGLIGLLVNKADDGIPSERMWIHALSIKLTQVCAIYHRESAHNTVFSNALG
jgi:hypothetical protein